MSLGLPWTACVMNQASRKHQNRLPTASPAVSLGSYDEPVPPQLESKPLKGNFWRL
ncbi:hypothetical protein M404DRAFT_998952 [Pisolithus tinctorius Marx 270]|uniref:Uncharacterized protein n=1 Tax=Pisolithus tinctorius Marx 270 TaxID=870435 RepID=A0A0C3K9R5_PISTI|nr:hypothetical protein M404DRAFT_998952 [Pisolithus tinctorius Marx 270]